MRKVGRDNFLLDSNSPLWYRVDALRCVPGVKPRLVKDKLVELIIHRSHLPLLRALDQVYSPQDLDEGPFSSPYDLRDYQKEAVRFAQVRFGSLFAHDLGLGKSAMALASLELPALIVCPTSALYVWMREAEAHGLSYQVLQGLSSSVDLIDPQVKLWITTYGSLHAWLPFFRRCAVGPSILGLLVDEAQALHSFSGASGKLLRSIIRDQTIALTATPTRNRLASLHGILDFLATGAWGYRSEFRQRYAGAIDNGYGLQDGEPTHTEELEARVREVACWESWTSPRVKHLRPELVTETIPLEMSSGELYDMTRMALAQAYQGKVHQPSPLPYQTAQKAVAGIAKATWLSTPGPGLDLLQSLLVAHDRIIWWCWHKAVARGLHKVLTDLGRPSDIVTGDDLTTKRTRVLDEWQNGSGPRNLVATMGALSSSVNITTAQAAVLVELSWAPIDIQQAEARHHRPGNINKKVYSYYLTVPGTIEDRIAEVLIEKLEDHELVFGPSSQHDQILSLREER